MSNVQTTKPPWLTVQWTSNPGFFTKYESKNIQTGEWKEDINMELYTLKERIQPFDRTELWDLAKRITNPYELIHTISSRLHLPKSLCLIKPLSRSFFKMVEILQVMRFFETKSRLPRIRSLHLCEGPGGFIEALYYKAAEHNKPIQTAYGMTLRSSNQMIPGWRRATPFLQKHSSVKLVYGPKNTGDIYDPENQEYLRELCKKQSVHLVTADGGFDFSDDFHAQEKMIFRLLVSSALIALQTLIQEGDFILKIFDIQSQTTRDFITLIGSCFKQWTIYKPATSRPCNSEWYFIGSQAIINREPVISIVISLRNALAEGKTFEKILDINHKEEYLQILQKERMEKQLYALQHVLKYCDGPQTNEEKDALWLTQKEPSKIWCSTFKMPFQCSNFPS